MPTLEKMIEWARTYKMTPDEAAEQRISFVYGNCKIENENVTKEMVAEVAKTLRAPGQPQPR